jgi:hypothetical protein
LRRNHQLHWIIFFVLLLTIAFISANLIKDEDASLNFPFQSLESGNHHQQILISNSRSNINYLIKTIQSLTYCPLFSKLAGSVLESLDLKIILDLLFPTQLIALFFIFYQISRTSSERDLPDESYFFSV